MTKELLAERLNGCEMMNEISGYLESEAEKFGLVVVFGGSDDLMEFRGAIHDEIDAYEGATAFVDAEGLLPEREQIDNDEELEKFFQRKKTAKIVRAVWHNSGDTSWTYETEILHVSFDVMEDGEKYCRGIVFELPVSTRG